MWTIVRFTLEPHDAERTAEALALLARGGLHVHLVPAGGEASGAGCAAAQGVAAGDVHADTALVTRCVYIALRSAGFAPLMVSARHARRAPPDGASDAAAQPGAGTASSGPG